MRKPEGRGLKQAYFKHKIQKQTILLKFLQTDKKVTFFIFYCLSCLVFSHFVFPVRLRSASSLAPVNCFASWLYASSKVI